MKIQVGSHCWNLTGFLDLEAFSFGLQPLFTVVIKKIKIFGKVRKKLYLFDFDKQYMNSM